MIGSASSIESQVKAFCSLIGADRLLVQGPGGNVSWKDGANLWVKASGTWLSEAESKEIFVPVNLTHLQDALSKQDFSIKPEMASGSCLRPSIETLLHALMPHRIVVHLHAVEILAHLVRNNAKKKFQNLVDNSFEWIFVDYFKPGADLARAVFDELKNSPNADVVFMCNHGLIIGADTIDVVLDKLYKLQTKLKTSISQSLPRSIPAKRQSDFATKGYVLCDDKSINLLAIKDEFIIRLRNDWALYPDHVVFLDSNPTILEKDFKKCDLDKSIIDKPSFIFALGEGVYQSNLVTQAQMCQLRCYYDVISRQDKKEKLSKLTQLQISELLDWDAEKFRKNITN
jgi:rhamnose utilization protein RhaD (predicted bifunctional aldolase and dehydrogenase)